VSRVVVTRRDGKLQGWRKFLNDRSKNLCSLRIITDTAE